MIEEEYVTTREAAEILDVSSGWVAALCRSGSLEAHRGVGRGAPWRIRSLSVYELKALREGVDEGIIEEVAREIEEDEQAKKWAEERAEESFMDRVLTIAKKYAPGVALMVAGAAGQWMAPGEPISLTLFSLGLKKLFDR
jgi:glycine/D-amino acid oxidase-like deaminating enzyme